MKLRIYKQKDFAINDKYQCPKDDDTLIGSFHCTHICPFCKGKIIFLWMHFVKCMYKNTNTIRKIRKIIFYFLLVILIPLAPFLVAYSLIVEYLIFCNVYSLITHKSAFYIHYIDGLGIVGLILRSLYKFIHR